MSKQLKIAAETTENLESEPHFPETKPLFFMSKMRPHIALAFEGLE